MSAAGQDARATTVVFGVLGGVAAGKSAVSAAVAGPRGLVIDADALAREALDLPEVRRRLVEAFGAEILAADGTVRRDELAKHVFASQEDRQRLEDWIHPIVRGKILSAIAHAETSGVERVVLDVPLLLENDSAHGLVSLCHHLVFVEAPLAEREHRAVEQRGWTHGEVARREAAQLPLDAKRRRADYVIENAGTREQLIDAVERVLADIGTP